MKLRGRYAQLLCESINCKEQEAFDHENKLLKSRLAVIQEEPRSNQLALASTSIVLDNYSNLINEFFISNQITLKGWLSSYFKSKLIIDTLRKNHNSLDKKHNVLKQNVDVLKQEIIDFNKSTNRNTFRLSHLKRSCFDACRKLFI